MSQCKVKGVVNEGLTKPVNKRLKGELNDQQEDVVTDKEKRNDALTISMIKEEKKDVSFKKLTKMTMNDYRH